MKCREHSVEIMHIDVRVWRVDRFKWVFPQEFGRKLDCQAFSLFETIPISLIRNVFWVKWNCFTFLKKHLSFFIRVKESFSGNSVKISGCQHLVNLSLYLAARHLVTVLFYTSAFFLNTKQKLLLSVQLNWSPE